MYQTQLVKITLFVSFCIALGACGKKEGEKQNGPPGSYTPSAGPQPYERSAVPGFSAELQALPEPNQYSVNLKIENIPFNFNIRKLAEDGTAKWIPVQKSVSTLSDTEVLAGKKYEYSVVPTDTVNNALLKSVWIEIPKDLAITGTVNRIETRGINRLFLMPGARIQTLGLPFDIQVNELISRNAILETFSDGTRAAATLPGKQAGLCTIRAKKAQGNLAIYNRGEDGGEGVQGAKGPVGAKGAKGVDGASLQNPAPHCHLPRPPFIPAPPDCIKICTRQIGAGAPGNPGGRGATGSIGAKGGATAPVYVQVETSEGFRADVRHLPGKGGFGGRGGEGGEGGPGGDPGSPDSAGICPQPAPAQPGPRGQIGAEGPRGLDGEQSPVCLKIGLEESSDCSKIRL